VNVKEKLVSNERELLFKRLLLKVERLPSGFVFFAFDTPLGLPDLAGFDFDDFEFRPFGIPCTVLQTRQQAKFLKFG
jgi:hypothetical protein